MSYILDALRRADAERQRGGVPGLHDQASLPAGGGMAAAPAGAPARSPWPGLAGGALLLVALGGAWWLGRGTAATPVAAVAPPPAPVPVHVQVQVTPAPVTPAPATSAKPLPAAPPAAPPTVAPPRVAAPPAASTVPRDSAPTQAAASPAPPVAVAADAPADPVRPWASLPESTRSAVPALAWSGAVHAERAEQRLVIVNGQVAREGDTIATGVQLLQIRQKSVLLRWQGQRIEMPL